MQSRIYRCITAMTVFTALAIPVRSLAQDQGHHKTHYTVKILGTLGGKTSAGNGINNRNWVTGGANLAGDAAQHAVIWIDGLRFDLGTLGGPNSLVQFPVKSNRGQIAGLAETSTTDPLGEDFCQLGTGFTCQAFLWQFGEMAALPTLGGNNGRAAGVNNRGQVVGWAENTTHDSTCTGKQVLQFEAVIWEPNGQMTQLPPLSPDPDGAAVAINEKGQVVGISGLCANAVGGLSAEHAVLWENGTVTYLGGFGGAAFNTAAAINNRGQVAGWSDLTGDTDVEAFFWTKEGGMQKVGFLSGDTDSLAYGINEQGQVVGQSINSNESRAFIWQNGKITDLNSLVPPGSLPLVYAGDINDRGEITGGALDTNTNQLVAFLAVPDSGGDDGKAAPPTVQAEDDSGKVILPEGVRQQLERRLGLGHVGAGR